MRNIGTVVARLMSRYQDWKDAGLDRRYGIDTCGHVSLGSLGASGKAYEGAEDYEPVSAAMFGEMIAAAGVRSADFLFVDYGSGKGRALILASKHGFRRAVGIEFVRALHDVALDNVDRFSRQRPLGCPIEARFGDAATFELPDEDALLFFYNPFGEAVLRKVFTNIELAYRRSPRRLLIAYRNPLHSHVFDEASFLTCITRDKRFAVYRADA